MIFIKKTSFPTEDFIKRQMTNKNGTVATYLQTGDAEDADLVSGREALSETLGLSMQYALAKDDEKAFRESYQLLKTYFIDDDGLVFWKLTPAGQANVTTNATVDDLRIISALIVAYQRWGDNSYLSTSQNISRYLMKNNQRNHLLVDYYDASLKLNSENVTLSYLDAYALTLMGSIEDIDQRVLHEMNSLLASIPSDQLFYPKLYSVPSGNFIYEDEVNMIDQILVGINRTKIGKQDEKFYQFIKAEFTKTGKIYGRYHRKSNLPAVAYESPAAYALAIQLAFEKGDQKFAQKLYKRMTQFREENRFSTNYGAYSINAKHDTHIFDNLLSLLAEINIHKSGLTN